MGKMPKKSGKFGEKLTNIKKYHFKGSKLSSAPLNGLVTFDQSKIMVAGN